MPHTGSRDALHTVQNVQVAVQRADAGDLTIDPVAPRQSIHYLRIEGLAQGLRFADRCG